MTRHASSAAVAMTALLLSLPAAAQQAPAPDSHHPGGSTPPATPAAPAQATPAPAPGTPGGMGMMSGPGGMGMMGMMSGEGRPSGMPAMRHHGAYGSPMNVIINIGPGIRLDVEDADRSPGPPRPGMMRGMMPGGMQGGSPMGGMAGRSGMAGTAPMAGPLHEMLAERVEGGLAFLRAELRIRPDQEAIWTAFAGRIREAAARYRSGVERMPAPAVGLEARLAMAETRLAAELERARACREAAAALLPALDEAQRRTVDALAWLVIPGGGPGIIAGTSSSTGR